MYDFIPMPFPPKAYIIDNVANAYYISYNLTENMVKHEGGGGRGGGEGGGEGGMVAYCGWDYSWWNDS